MVNEFRDISVFNYIVSFFDNVQHKLWLAPVILRSFFRLGKSFFWIYIPFVVAGFWSSLSLRLRLRQVLQRLTSYLYLWKLKIATYSGNTILSIVLWANLIFPQLSMYELFTTKFLTMIFYLSDLFSELFDVTSEPLLHHFIGFFWRLSN